MSQSSLVLPTSGTLPGLTAVQDINAALDTLNTLASGASAPSTPEAGQLWHDTGNKALKLRSMDNTSWITLGSLDETNYLFTAARAAVAASLSGTLAIANGGTGASSAATALAALLTGSEIPQANGGTGTSSVRSLFTTSFGQNGYEVSPSGRVTQWGVTGVIGASGGASTIGFPVSFPNSCLNVTATIVGTGAVLSNNVSALNFTASTFQLVNSSTSNVQAWWRAEGY